MPNGMMVILLNVSLFYFIQFAYLVLFVVVITLSNCCYVVHFAYIIFIVYP